MKLTLSPTRGLPGQLETVLAVDGDSLIVDGITYDLSQTPEGPADPEATANAPFTAPTTRENGEIHASVAITMGDNAAADQPADPAHWVVTVAKGKVELPILYVTSGA